MTRAALLDLVRPLALQFAEDLVELLATKIDERVDDALEVARRALQAGLDAMTAAPGIERPWRWSEMSIGTRAYSSRGGWWERTERGWTANGGDTFPTPGGDVSHVEVPTKEPRGIVLELLEPLASPTVTTEEREARERAAAKPTREPVEEPAPEPIVGVLPTPIATFTF